MGETIEETVETVYERLTAKGLATFAEIRRMRLPGWEDVLESNTKARQTIEEWRERLESSIHDEDEYLVLKACSMLLSCWARVNEILAEAYRKAVEDPSEWSLRYVKWMKIHYLRFDSPHGEFYIFPQKPRRKPKLQHWYTADEALDMMTPTARAVLKLCGGLPIKEVEPPDPGEKYMHVDFTGPEMVVKYEFEKGPRYGRKGIR